VQKQLPQRQKKSPAVTPHTSSHQPTITEKLPLVRTGENV